MDLTAPQTCSTGRCDSDYRGRFSGDQTSTTRSPARGPTLTQPLSCTTSTAPWIWTWGWIWQRITITPEPSFATWGSSVLSKSSSVSGSNRSSSAIRRRVAIKLSAPCMSWSPTSRSSTLEDPNRATTSAFGKSVPGKASPLKPNINWSITYACIREKNLSPARSLDVAKSSRDQKTSRFTREHIQVWYLFLFALVSLMSVSLAFVLQLYNGLFLINPQNSSANSGSYKNKLITVGWCIFRLWERILRLALKLDLDL